MKVLVTGGCGFLGSNITSFFLKKDFEVHVIDSLFRDGSKENLKWLKNQGINKKFSFSNIDIAIGKLVDQDIEAAGPFDYVVHVAGQVAMTTSLINPRRDFETNVLGTFNILESVRKYSPKALVAYSSTNKVYGDLEKLSYGETDTRYTLLDFPDGIDENTQLDFSTPYGCSKGAADQYVRDWGRVYGMKTVVFRHSSIYGGRQFASFDQGWIGWFCKKALEQKYQILNQNVVEQFTISGTGKQVRDVIHSDDLVNLYWMAFLNKEKLNGEIFNIGGGFENSLSLIELFEFLSSEINIESLKYQKIERRTSDQDCFIASISKSETVLNWVPKVDYKEGLSRMISWTEEM